MTNYYDSSHRYKPKEDTPILISSNEWIRDPNPSYYCNFCQRRLSKLTSHGLSPSWYCSSCNIEVDPSLTELRSASKLTTPDGPPDNPVVSHTPEVGLVRKKTEIKGGLAELQKRGIKITSYSERNVKK